MTESNGGHAPSVDDDSSGVASLGSASGLSSTAGPLPPFNTRSPEAPFSSGVSPGFEAPAEGDMFIARSKEKNHDMTARFFSTNAFASVGEASVFLRMYIAIGLSSPR